MARVNIEEESWTRLYRLAEIMDISIREAVGTVTCLWHRSQDLVQHIGTCYDIIDWASLTKIPIQHQEKWIQALEKSFIISRLNQDQYEIRGNKIQIESRVARIDRSRKGAKALMKKVRKMKSLEAGLKQAPSTLEAGSNALKAMQCNSIQGNSIQGNAIQEINITKIPKKSKKDHPSDDHKANAYVAAYCSRFKNRWGHNPEILGKESGIIKRLSKNLSLEKFEIYLDAYFDMPDAFLAKAKHPIGMFETKLNEITVYASTGNFTTNRQVRQADDFASNMILLNEIREGKA